MSPEKPTPQHDDQTTAELIIAKRLWARSNPGGWPEFGSVAITYANKARELVNELKAAGFEILTPDERAWFGGLMAQVADEPTELGVTKGLPGLGESLEALPNNSALNERALRFAGQNAGIAMAAMLETLAPVSADDRLAAALDLIGRRADIVAVKLPEPTAPDFTGVEWSDKAAGWDVFAYGSTEHRGKVQVRIPEFVAPADARNAAAALYAAAALADAAEGEAK